MTTEHLRSASIVLLGIMATCATTALAAIQGVSGPPEGIRPVVRTAVPGGGPGRPPAAVFQAPLGFEISAQHHEHLKHSTPPPFPVGGSEIVTDPNSAPPEPADEAQFPGPLNNGWIPYDAAVAVGPSHVLALVNSSWTVYTKAGVQQAYSTFDAWWGLAAGSPFDPKCFYDDGHFVMLATSVGNGLANMYVSVSQTDDPTGAWWNYTFDWRLDGATLTGNWGDYPGLGYDDNAIYISANQYTISANFFQYAKVRVLDKAALYSGSAGTYTDFVNLFNADGTKAFTVKPARCLSSSSSEYLLNTRSGGGNSVTLWRIDGAPGSPTLTRVATVSVGSYSVPPDAPQKGGSNKVATNDCRTQEVVYRDGTVHTAFTERVGSRPKDRRAALRYLAISTAGAKQKDTTYQGSSGVHLYYPAVTNDANGNLAMFFNRSSGTEYISMYVTKMPAGGSFGASSLLAAGTTYMIQSRWGDYSGVHNDPLTGEVWGMCGTARNSVWATDIVAVTLP
jgi:hypothetical protein